MSTTNGLTVEQRKYLLSDLSPARVSSRSQSGRSFSYLASWDVRRTLIRVFGFGGFSVTADQAECISHEEGQGKSGSNHVVCWKVRVTLEIPSLGATYSEYAVGSANLPSLPDAHDMAIKTAESDALKRAAINLGTQFGLSLYDDGQTRDVVGSTLDDSTVRLTPAVVPEALGGPAPQDEPQAAPEAPAEPEPPLPLSEDGEALLGVLRAARTVTDDAERIRVVTEAKVSYCTVLDQVTRLKDGHEMTLGRLADMVATGVAS